MNWGPAPLASDISGPESLWPDPQTVIEIRAGEESALILSLLGPCDQWLDDYSSQFDPFVWETPVERYARRKAFAEASIYLYVAAEHGNVGVAPQLRRLVLDTVAKPEYRDLVLRYPRHFLLFSSPILYAASQGELPQDLKEAVERVLSGRTLWSAERLPHRMMDIWNFCTAYGIPCQLGESAEFLELGCIGQPLDPIEANLRDAYALTHHLMFYYNFGVRSPGFLGNEISENLAETLLALTIRFLAEGNCDIVLELIMVGVFHKQFAPGMARLVLGWLNAKVQEHGNVPGPEADEAHRIDLDDSRFQAWYADYHTTLVAASTLRTLQRDWGDMHLRLPANLVGPSDWDHLQLQRVGESLNRIHRYELPLGVSQLHEIIQVDPPTHLRPAIAAASEFIERQRTADGQFGFFPDEKAAYESENSYGEGFHESIAAPLTEICEAFCEAAHQRQLQNG